VFWWVLALATALSISTGDALTKKFFGRFSPLEMAVNASLYSLPFLFAALSFATIPKLGRGFWWLVLVPIPLNTMAFSLHESHQGVYMIPVKRTSILFGLLYGRVLFNEN